MGFTLAQLSEMSGVDVGTISALEIRDSSRSKYFSPLAKAMGLSVEQLEDESRESTAPPALPTIKPRSEKEIAIAHLVEIAGDLDMLRIGQLIERATTLRAEMPAKQTHKSSQ